MALTMPEFNAKMGVNCILNVLGPAFACAGRKPSLVFASSCNGFSLRRKSERAVLVGKPLRVLILPDRCQGNENPLLLRVPDSPDLVDRIRVCVDWRSRLGLGHFHEILGNSTLTTATYVRDAALYKKQNDDFHVRKRNRVMDRGVGQGGGSAGVVGGRGGLEEGQAEEEATG